MNADKVRVIVHGPECPIADATIPAKTKGGGITTGNPGSGQPNVTHYDVTIGDRVLRGEWRGDARWPITVNITQSDELAGPIIKIAALQAARRDRKGFQAPARGWTAADIMDAETDLDSRFDVAQHAVEDDPVATRLLAPSL